jgi:prepilin-type N-terminal cleavage/methylation domain-containing protein
MSYPALLKTLLQIHQKTTADKLKSHPQSNAGFTLIEFLVVVIIIAVLSAIAAPGWLGFVSQRRVNAANETILRSVQQAQSEAKKTKQSYSVSLLVPSSSDDVPKIAVSQGSDPPADTSPLWKSVGEGIRPGQIWLGTNVTSSNTVGNNLDQVPSDDPTKIITFDYMGTVPPTAARSIIVVGVPAPGNSSNPVPQTRRCVEVTTLLGAIRGGRPVEGTGGTSDLQCLPR